MKDPNVSQLQILMSLTTPVLGKIRQVNFRKKNTGFSLLLQFKVRSQGQTLPEFC